MTQVANIALDFWGFHGADCAFVAGRENLVFKVTCPRETYALRVKRPGYRTVDELRSELDWLAEMHRAGLRVPEPLPSLGGNLLE